MKVLKKVKEIYADLHIHIGRTKSGRPVKITGSKRLTLRRILEAASERKGIDLVGIIDCHSPEVIEEIEEMIQNGEMVELVDGGLQFGQSTLILGSEIEIYDENCHGPIHVLAYFPTIEIMKTFSMWMSGYVKNINLSSQRIYCDGITLQKKVRSLGGLFIPAHVFTPFKSLYGKGVLSSLSEVFDPAIIDGIELGLSSDTYMVRGIKELEQYTFLTNSDAHSVGKIAREYQKVRLDHASFAELQKALQEKDGRAIVANYGLNPLLGKYYQTVCAGCAAKVDEGLAECPLCHKHNIIKGVATRIKELSEIEESVRQRPPYIHQVPLDFIPGLGPKSLERLLLAVGTEMNILHKASYKELKAVVPDKLVRYIDQSRKGELLIEVGGGGKYGKVQKEES